MKVKDIVDILKCQVLNEGDMEEPRCTTACGSDMMSDVLAFVKDQSVLLTGLVNPQVVRTAEMMDMRLHRLCARARSPTPDMVELARQTAASPCWRPPYADVHRLRAAVCKRAAGEVARSQ